MNSKKLNVILFIAGTVAACSGGGNPSPPAIGAQIDRMGRAGVNTALTDPFSTVQGQTSDQVKDAYNAASDPNSWSSFIGGPVGSYIAGNLAILDALDGVCGNQPFAKPGTPPPADRYKPLATVLADDQLYLNTSAGTCANYLAVETGVPNDCGGRTPLYNTIDVTYAVVAGPAQPVVNGITQDNDGNASLTTFPFLANPN